MTDIALSLDDPTPDDGGQIESSREELPLTDASDDAQSTETPKDATETETPTAESEPESKSDEAEATPEPPKEVPVAALQAERTQKQAARQEAEQLRDEVAKLSQALSSLQQPKPEAPVKAEPLDPDEIFTNPQKVIDHITTGFEQKLSQVEQSNRESLNNLSEAHAIQRYGREDYQAQLAAFQNAAKDNPALIAELAKQSDPAEWAYQQGKTRAELAEVGDVGALRQRIEAEVKAKVLEEMKAEKEKAAAALAAVPDALSETTTRSDVREPRPQSREIRLALD